MAPLWRLAGNPAFEQSQQRIFDRLAAAGLQPKYETYRERGQRVGPRAQARRALAVPAARSCCRSETHRVALAINSFSTAAGGVTLRLVDVGAGTTDAAYEGKNVKGAIVLATGTLGAGLGRRPCERAARPA